MDLETKKSRNGSVSRTEYERTNHTSQNKVSAKTGVLLRNMTLMAQEEVCVPEIAHEREMKPPQAENIPKSNPQFVECYQADIFDFCMKTEVTLKNVDFFGATICSARI